jgi:hypothetical protein
MSGTNEKISRDVDEGVEWSADNFSVACDPALSRSYEKVEEGSPATL